MYSLIVVAICDAQDINGRYLDPRYTIQVSRNYKDMESGQSVQFEYIFGQISLGVAILESDDLRIRYANPFLRSLLNEPWCHQDVVGQRVSDVLPEIVEQAALPIMRDVIVTGERVCLTEVPYEGFIESRGRTYWRISIERTPVSLLKETLSEKPKTVQPSLSLTLEDMTESVRSRLHLNAIHHISAVIAGPSALPQVLERILQALRELVGATRCAILLADQSAADMHLVGYEEQPNTAQKSARTAHIAAFKGIHPVSQEWHPTINDHLLLDRVRQSGHALIITDTSTIPDVDLPFVDDDGRPRRPGSVLCVPIIEPYHDESGSLSPADGTILGSIEVYHRRVRGFPDEEARLLERFAQQVGLAIHNARLFRSVDRWAHAASRNARQKENVMRTIPDGVVICDPRWRVAEANPAARKLFGWEETIIGTPIDQAMLQSSSSFQSDLSHQSIDELERSALSGQINEVRLLTSDMRPITISSSYTPIRDELGDIFAFVIVYHDITEEVAARERVEAQVVVRTAELAQRNDALLRAKTEQEQVLARLPSGVMLVSAAEQRITVINDRALEILHQSGFLLKKADNAEDIAANIIGMSCEALFRSAPAYGTSGSLVPYEEQPICRALSSGEASEAELHVVTQNGQSLYVLINAAPLRAPSGTMISVVVVMHDITTVKALERAREDFFTTMAHELKTPLANIRAHLSALLAQDLQWSREKQFDFLYAADDQIDRLVGMVNHFLDASRVEAGALRLELEPILLPEMLEDLQDRLEALIAASQRQLKVTLPAGIPAVQGDYELILGVLTNLLSNAFRYAPQGDTVYLEIDPVQPAGAGSPVGVTLSVRDRGPGMTPEQQSAVFTRFSTFAAMSRPAVDRPGQPAQERRIGTSRWSPATGLGLYISRGIIEAHGSKLELKSSPGHGATFSFTLPVYKGMKRGSKRENRRL